MWETRECANDLAGGQKPWVATKKKTLIAAEQCAHKRAAFRERVAPIAIERFVFLDEMGVRVGMTPLYGRAPGGERVVCHVNGAIICR